MNEMRKLMEAVEQLNEGPFSDQDPTQLKSEEDFFKRILALTDEADELLDSDKPVNQKFRVLDQILQDIANITRLRQMGRDYEDVEESKYIEEGASSRQWEIAINNLIAEGEERFSVAGATIEEKKTWNWVRDELHGMLDFQPDSDDDEYGDRYDNDPEYADMSDNIKQLSRQGR